MSMGLETCKSLLALLLADTVCEMMMHIVAGPVVCGEAMHVGHTWHDVPTEELG